MKFCPFSNKVVPISIKEHHAKDLQVFSGSFWFSINSQQKNTERIWCLNSRFLLTAKLQGRLVQILNLHTNFCNDEFFFFKSRHSGA